MLYCLIHDLYFDTVSEFEDHVEYHQQNPPPPKPVTASAKVPEEVTEEQGE